MSDRQPVQSAAFSVAMSAKTDGLTLHQVDAMRTVAEQLLDHGDPLRLACLHFATMYEAHRRDPDPYALRAFACELQRAVDADLHPDRPARQERRDIDG